jgi:hypothetical protein
MSSSIQISRMSISTTITENNGSGRDEVEDSVQDTEYGTIVKYSEHLRFPNKSPKKNILDLHKTNQNQTIDRCVPASSIKFDPNTFANSPPNYFMENLTQRMNCYYSNSLSA